MICADAMTWRCQSCGTSSNLEVHHRKFRSHSGADSEENWFGRSGDGNPHFNLVGWTAPLYGFGISACV